MTPGRLLIVDDEAPQLKALCDTLSEKGYEIVGKTSPIAALDALRDSPFDLLLTDLRMPEMDGIEFLQHARTIDPELVAIMMTGHGAIDTAVEAMKSGAIDYILKPFKLREVIPAIERALSVRRLRVENQQLQQRVQDRTRELEALNKELEAFAHSVSHDLRSPLRAVNRYSFLVMRDYAADLPEMAIPLLRFIEQSAQKALNLVDVLLEFSRTSRQEITRQPLCIREMVQQIIDELAPDRTDRAVSFKIGDLPNCDGDWDLLRQVWINLISNAQKFTRQRTEAIVEIGSANSGELVYFVRDNGAGFDMKYAERVFEVFQRLHRADEFEGTGVGLSVVQRIIHRHGGRIWAEGTPGKGAAFFFTVPTAQEPANL